MADSCEVEVEGTTGTDSERKFAEVAKYLSTGTYPANVDKSTKASIRKRAKSFAILELLHYVGEEKTQTPRLVIAKEEEQQRLIRLAHNANINHHGRDKTLDELKPYYYWPGMYNHVVQYVSIIILLCIIYSTMQDYNTCTLLLGTIMCYV